MNRLETSHLDQFASALVAGKVLQVAAKRLILASHAANHTSYGKPSRSRPSEPDQESFEEGMSGIRLMAQGIRRMLREGLWSEKDPKDDHRDDDVNSDKNKYNNGHNNARLPMIAIANEHFKPPVNPHAMLRPPFQPMFFHVPPEVMKPKAWEPGAPNIFKNLLGGRRVDETGHVVGPILSAFANVLGPEKTKEELIAELRKVTMQFVEGLSGAPKQTFIGAIDRALDKIKELSIDEIRHELRMVLERVRTAESIRHLQQNAWIHGENIIREGQALQASSTPADPNAPRPLIPVQQAFPRLVPRTLREKFASNMVLLLHPYVPLAMQSDLLVEQKSAWIPSPLIWMLLHAVVNPLLLLKIGYINVKRRAIMVMFGAVVMLLPTIPFPFSLVLIKFLLQLFGQG